MTRDELFELTNIDPWWLAQLEELHKIERCVRRRVVPGGVGSLEGAGRPPVAQLACFDSGCLRGASQGWQDSRR